MKKSRISGNGRTTKTKTKQCGPTSDQIYATGKTYAALLDKKSITGKAYASQIRAIAATLGVAPNDVRRAIEFTKTVDRIEATCGSAAKTLILTNHPRLSARVVMKIGRTYSDRQRFALTQVKNDRNPFGKPPAGTDPPFDTHDCSEVRNRLTRNTGLVNSVTDGLLITPKKEWPGEEAMRAIKADTASIIKACRKMKGILKKVGGCFIEGRQQWNHRKPARPSQPAKARWKAASVRGIAAKNLRDLPRLFEESPPTLSEANAITKGAVELQRSAERLAAVVRSHGQSPLAGPLEVPGTYVVFYRLAEDALALKVGALGTFDFPAGIYAYLGSAFGGGGVKKRTHRHLTPNSPRKWNIDWLKPHCTPVAVWWTHDRDKVEFDWASALAGLPGADFPAPGFGASDNPKADAHLARFDHMPSINAFRRSVAKAMKGHAPVYEKLVEGWMGAGWPE